MNYLGGFINHHRDINGDLMEYDGIYPLVN